MDSTVAPVDAPDPMLERIGDALDRIRSEEFDYEILRAASEVLGEDVTESWRPSLSYLPPEQRGDEYHVTVFARGACESCPVKRLHVDTIEPKVRALVGADNVFVHDYFEPEDWMRQPTWGDG
jgi:hypothetical protein